MNPTTTSKSRRRRQAAQAAHIRERGLNATIVGRGQLREFHVTVEPLQGESIRRMVKRLHTFLSAYGAVIIREEVFGLRSVADQFLRATTDAAGVITWPVSWLEGEPVGRGGVAGVHLFAVSGVEVRWLFSGGRPVASIFSDGYARHCILGDINPASETEPRLEQADELFDLIDLQLSRARMEWKNVARTWLYLDRILEWYRDFNLVRKDAFDRFELYSHAMPASTGIGASNLAGAALTAGAWALAPLRPEARVEQVISPLQCSARDYGSCFSRAVEIVCPDLRRLMISGTASISRDGITEHRGDFWRQMARTFEVVDAILESRGMAWKNVSRATAYLRCVKDAAACEEFLALRRLRLPIIITRADVCRDDLLFEIELDALASPARPLRGNWEA